MSDRYKLYGVDFSLYSGKARSYLNKKGIAYDEILPTLSVYKRFIVPRTGVNYIPVLQTPDDEVFQDTTVIIDELEKRFPENSVYPTKPKQKLVSLLLEVYGDEWLVIPAMHYRWAYQDVNQPFIFQKFGGMVSPMLPAFIRGWLGKKLGDRFKGSVPLLGVKDTNFRAIEKSYLALLADLEQHFQQQDYLLGSRPSIGDFGMIGPMYAHLYHDPYPGELMRSKAPAVAKWVERMMDSQPAKGEFLPNDQIPDTLLPILRRMADEQLPVLMDTDRRLTQWRGRNPDARIPRSIGQHKFTIEGVTAQRIILPYALWMFKRPMDFYACLDPETQQRADNLLHRTGFGDTLKDGLQNRLIRVKNRLKFA
ncbi:MAG: glutathione S-transferase [Pseudomonadota bacterium]